MGELPMPAGEVRPEQNDILTQDTKAGPKRRSPVSGRTPLTKRACLPALSSSTD